MKLALLFGVVQLFLFGVLIAVHAATIPIAVGSQVTMTVTVQAGTPPFDYQWRRNGGNIQGANSASYVIAAVTAADVASYSVVVTNPAGSTTSPGEPLTVELVPPQQAIVTRAVIPPPAPSTAARTQEPTK